MSRIGSPTAPRSEVTIPARLPFQLSLAENIHVGTATTGDTVKAVLTADLRDQSKKVVGYRKARPFLCRILRIRRRYFHDINARALNPDGSIRFRSNPSARVELQLGLEDFALPGGQRPVYAQPDSRPGAPPSRRVKRERYEPPLWSW